MKSNKLPYLISTLVWVFSNSILFQTFVKQTTAKNMTIKNCFLACLVILACDLCNAGEWLTASGKLTFHFQSISWKHFDPCRTEKLIKRSTFKKS
jgi:uncharacterized membrane protein